MRYGTSFKARGHPNMLSTHGTTLMTTTERQLTLKGDCVVAVSAKKGLIDLDEDIKNAARSDDAVIKFTLEVDGTEFVATGRGHPGLTFSHPSDIVVRKSGFVCGRTLMVRSDKAACDVPREMATRLNDEGAEITVTITVDL
ncbi:DUF371 domain-containing protein [Candidatus Bathyarchaeota archaeon]|nr:DUF371 domain-containing protein [Candidatus Bathyarchaeota archaeon]